MLRRSKFNRPVAANTHLRAENDRLLADNSALTAIIKRLDAKVTRRNNQIRAMRRALAGFADFLGDARVEPVIPAKWRKWIKGEVRKI